MFISKKWLSSILAASLLFGLAGCKKDAPKSQEEVTQKIQALADGKWDKSDVNALIAFVPEDTPLVLASTREFDMNHPAMKKVMEKSKIVIDELVSMMSKYVPEGEDEEAKLARKMIDDIKAFSSDYSKTLKEYGINPERNDSIFYVDGALFVAKLTADDGSKLQAKIDAYAKSIPNLLIEEVKSGNDSFVFYGAKEDGNSIGIYVNYGKNIVTFVINADVKNNAPDLGRTLKVADKQLLKSKLGKVNSEVAALGYIDNEIVVDKILNSETIREIFGDAEASALFSPECKSDIKAIAAEYPRMNFVERIKGDSEFSTEFNLVIKDKETVKRLKSLHAESVKIAGDNAIISAGLNIDVGKTIAWIKEVATNIGQKEYACKPIKEATQGIGMLPMLLASPKTAQFVSIAEGISGINLSLDDFNFMEITKEKFDSIKAIVDVSGPTVGKVLPNALAFAASFSPELAGIQPNAENAVKIALPGELGDGFEINAYMTDNDFVIGTKNYDVKAIAKSSRKANPNFLEISLSSKIYNLIFDAAKASGEVNTDNEDIKAIMKIFESLSFKYSFAVGTNDDGLSYSVVTTL